MTEYPNDKKHDDFKFLHDFVEAVKEDTPSEEWNQAARQRLRDSLKSQKEESWIMNMIKNGSQKKIKWAIPISIATVLALVLIFGLPGMDRKNSSVAFAQIANQLRTARTMTFIITTSSKEMGKEILPKTQYFYKEPGLIRMSDETSVHIFDRIQKKGIFF